MRLAIKGILFDKDGVLLDYHRTFDPLNRSVALLAGDGDKDLADGLLRHCGYDAEVKVAQPGSLIAVATVLEIANEMVTFLGKKASPGLGQTLVEAFNRGPAQSYLVADCDTTLRALKAAGIALGIATNDSMAGLEVSLKPHNILQHFDFVAGYDAGFGGKPEPGMALAFCKTCDLDPTAIAMVGDNDHDIESGRRAGAGLCIGVLTGSSGTAELGPISDLVLNSIADLPGHPALK